MKPNEAIEKLDGLKICDESITQLEEIGFEHLQERYRTQNQALDYAIELAKRDEGMKVIQHDVGYTCPSCGNTLSSFRYSSLDDFVRNNKFCCHCGKHLDWSDVK